MPGEVSRRGFIAGSLAAGFALAVQPVAAQTVITTDAEGLEAGEVKVAVLGLYGAKDTGIPVESVERMREALKRSKSKDARASEIILYPEAGHGFHADYRPSYNKEAAAGGWRRLRA